MEKIYLNKEELETIQSMNREFNNMKLALGDIEMQKHEIMENVKQIKAAFGQHEQGLIAKYGADAVINMQTGEVSKKEPQAGLQVTKK